MSNALSLLSGASSRLGSRGSLASIHSGSADSISSWNRGHTATPDASGERGGGDGSGVAQKAVQTVKEGEGEGEKQGSSFATTSSKRKLPALMASTSPLRNVDAIVLVYDLDKMETFNRLESHWLPLIERCYNDELPVIIAGNKMDLLHQSSSVASVSDNQHFARSRQNIIALLQRFKFVRQVIKCSARNLLNVDDVFRKAQEAVLYPLTPLYDLNTGKLTASCTRALTRIFRVFDVDKDGLLSDSELNAFQHKIWGVTLFERDFSGWKKVVTQHNSLFQQLDESSTGSDVHEEVIRDGKFTVAGFLAIFDVFISQNRMETPWKVLRTFGYDDGLVLTIPEPISGTDFAPFHPKEWSLTESEVRFLESTFRQFDSDGDGYLSPEDMQSVFSVLSAPLPPWSERANRLFQGSFSIPLVASEGSARSSLTGVRFDPSLSPTPAGSTPPQSHPSSPSTTLSASGITISSSPLPSVDVTEHSFTQTSKPLSFLSWMNLWHMMCTISPSVCRRELFTLGFIPELLESEKETTAYTRRLCKVNPNSSPSTDTPTTVVKALILGSKGSGKTMLVRKLHRWQRGNGHTLETSSAHPTTSCSVSKATLPSLNSTVGENGVETDIHLILTEVSDRDAGKGNQRDRLGLLLSGRVYGMAVLVFDSADASSWAFVRDMETKLLNEDVPRVFVATTSGGKIDSDVQSLPAFEHCRDMDLEPPLVLSLDDIRKDSSALKYLLCCARHQHQNGDEFRSTPHGERKRREAAKRRKLIWFGGLVTASITVVLGLTVAKKRFGSERGGWFKSLLSSFVRTRP